MVVQYYDGFSEEEIKTFETTLERVVKNLEKRMNIDRSKIISDKSGEIEVLNVKLGDDIQNYLGVEGIYQSYHLSKKSWISIILDDTLSDKEIMDLIDISYNISNIRKSKGMIIK